MDSSGLFGREESEILDVFTLARTRASRGCKGASRQEEVDL